MMIVIGRSGSSISLKTVMRSRWFQARSAIITSSWFRAPEASQDWREKQGWLYRKLRRKPFTSRHWG
jgi:hypothetical protein